LLKFHQDYVKLYNKWHATLGAAVIGCMKSSEYMYVRAGLLVLTRIVDVFPTRPGLGQKLMDDLAPLQRDAYPLPDIRTSAQAYTILIEKARMEGVWKEEDKAVAQARADEQRAAVAEQKKKAEQQFTEMKHEGERITEQIGETETRGGDRR
jgi:THO complex subunit 2